MITTSTSGASAPAPADVSSVRQRKRAMRKAMASKLATLRTEQIMQQSARVHELILSSPEWQRAQSISIYVSMHSAEVITDQLCAAALQAGKRLYVPLFAAAPTPVAIAPPSSPSSPPSSSSTRKAEVTGGTAAAAVIAASPTLQGLPSEQPKQQPCGQPFTPFSAPPTPSTSAPSTPSLSEQIPPTPAVAAAQKQQMFASDMRMLRIRSQRDFDAMKMNKWGIREPLEFDDDEDAAADEHKTGGDSDSTIAGVPTVQSGGHNSSSSNRRRREDALQADSGGQGLDLILSPGVAFDAHCGRLGHGKGYYDRYIARTILFNQQCGRPPPAIIALALREQLLPMDQMVPKDQDDLPVTAVAMPDGFLRPDGSPGAAKSAS